MKDADVGVIVGRFQVPELHDAHTELIKKVCDAHQKVLMFLGLSPCKSTLNNPLDFEARKQMILEQFPKVNVLYIKDVPYDDDWSRKLDSQIEDLVTPNQSVVLYGGRDSFMGKYFGRYTKKELVQDKFVSGAEIRKNISKSVKSCHEFRAGVVWSQFNKYPTIFTTVDVAVFNEDKSKVLLVRKDTEKKYRFIGGFAQPNSESFEDDAKREVNEETGVEIGDLKYICNLNVDDWRYRSEVDKIRTMFFTAKHIFGPPKPGDDVCEARWINVDDLEGVLTEEHLPLLKKLNRRIK